ncbi:hypothetical protein NDA14_000377 [Ustilago hordei]|nr:hypothetical protein NDA14_000377 [Ustilago hordei]
MPSATTSNSHTTYPSDSSSIASSTSPATAVTQRARLRSSPDPPLYQSHGSTGRTCVSQSRAASNGDGKARASYARNSYASQQEQGWEQDATCTDDFFDDEDEEDYYQGQRKDSDHRPLLERSSNSASCASRSKKGDHPGTKRSNSIKMKRSNSHRLADEYKDDERAAKSAGQEVLSYTPRNSSRRGSSAEGQGSRGPKHVSLDEIFDPTKTLMENKSMMISAELDRMGMGTYQMCIWFLCGCGYFIDLLWAQALGLIVTQVAYEFDDQIQGRTGPLQTAFSAGLRVGALFFGFAVDVVGRRWSFYVTTLIASVFGIASGGAGSFETLCVLAALIGFGIGGNMPIDATITIEFLPCKRRLLVAALCIFQPLGVLVCSGISYGLIPKYACDSAASCRRSNNMGWRYTLFTLGCITWLVFVARFFMFTLRESPEYLLARGKDAKALKIIQQILITNKSKIEPLFTQADFREAAKRIAAHQGGEYMDQHMDQDREEREGLDAGGGKASRLQQAKKSAKEMVALFLNAKTLFGDGRMARVTTIIWITFIGDFWGFTLAGFYLPQMLRAKGAAEDTSMERRYRNYILIYLPGILAVALGAAMIEVPKLGRQWAMVVSSALMAVSFFLFTMVETQAASIGANAAEYFAQSFFNCILYAFVAEIYPSQVRGTASGLASTLGRLASIVAPLAADALYRDQSEQQAKQVLYLAASVTLLCPVALALLPYDTRGIRVY